MRKVLVKTNLHNVFYECREDEQDNSTNKNLEVIAHMQPLLRELSKKQPTWAFVCTSKTIMDHANLRYGCTTFDVMCDGEKLGRLWSERHWRTGERKFAYDNKRMSAQRQRGRHTETKNLKKAVKDILTNMYPTTVQEYVHGARSVVSGKFSNTVFSLRKDRDNAVGKLQDTLVAFALDNPDTIKQYAPSAAEWVDNLFVTRDAYGPAEAASKAHQNGNSWVVACRGDTYYVSMDKSGGEIETYTIMTLPDRIKQAVGVLKIAPDGTFVPGLGYRAYENTYLVFDE